MIHPMIIMITFLLGIAFILWGKKLFKFYIVLMGILMGAVLGAVLGLIIGKSAGAATFSALLLGALFGFIALPLHKLFVFIIAGFMGGSLSALILSSLGLTGKPLFALCFIFFTAVGLLALKYYDHILVIIMAYTGVELLYNSIFLFYMNQSAKSHYYDLPGLLKKLTEIVTYNWRYFLCISFLMILFTLYFQIRMEVKKEDDIRVKENKLLFRKITYLYAFLAILAVISFGFFGAVGKHIGNIMVFNYITFGFLALATYWFISRIIPEIDKLSFIRGAKLKRFLALGIFGLTVFPLLSGIIMSLIAIIGEFSTPPLDTLIFEFKMLFHEEPVVALFKWIFLGGLIPVLLYHTAYNQGFNNIIAWEKISPGDNGALKQEQ